MRTITHRELYHRYRGVYEPWQIKLALGRLRYFRIPHHHWEDMMQELSIVVMTFRYDREKAKAASRETILCRLFDNRIRTLALSHG